MAKYENPAEKRAERVRAVQGAVRNDVEPTRIPIYSNGHTWWISDSGYTLSECIYDWMKMYNAVSTYAERYDPDFYTATGGRNPLRIPRAAGLISDYNMENGTGINIQDGELMSADQYPQRIEEGNLKFKFENILGPKYSSTEEACQKLAAAAKEVVTFMDYQAKIDEHLYNYYAVPHQAAGLFGPPMESLLGLRGLRGMSIDMRRQADNVQAFCDKTFEENGGVALLDAAAADPADKCFSVWTYGCAHVMMNAKQFDRYYMPYFKALDRGVAERDMTCLYFLEGTVKPMLDCIRELTPGHTCIFIEDDDLVESKKALEGFSLLGGMHTTALGTGTVQECLDEAKHIIDDAGYDGKLIFTTAKILSWPNDAKSENLKAVNEFVKEYGKMKS